MKRKHLLLAGAIAGMTGTLTTQVIMRYRREKHSALARLQTNSKVIKTTCGPVEYAMQGQGPAVLISHGGGGGYDMGLWLAGLIGGTFQYVAPSRFGYLRTPLPAQPTPEAQADVYAALLDTLDVSSAAIIGLSAGGPSALQFALRHPARCRALVMLSAISRTLPSLSPALQAGYAFMLRSDFIPWLVTVVARDAVYRANGINRGLLARIRPDQKKMGLLAALQQTIFPTSVRRAGNVNDMQQTTNLPEYPLEHLATPALVIHAENDPVVPFEHGKFSAQTIPRAQFVQVDDGGHFCCITHQEEINPALLEFLRRQEI